MHVRDEGMTPHMKLRGEATRASTTDRERQNKDATSTDGEQNSKDPTFAKAALKAGILGATVASTSCAWASNPACLAC